MDRKRVGRLRKNECAETTNNSKKLRKSKLFGKVTLEIPLKLDAIEEFGTCIKCDANIDLIQLRISTICNKSVYCIKEQLP